MTHDWVLDVLADLKTFAARNGLKALADHLGDGEMIAAAELASMEGRLADRRTDGDNGKSTYSYFAAIDNA